MSSLRSSPFSLPFETLVTAKVLAHNVRGWSIASLANTVGPTIQTEPTTMAAPTRGSTTSTTVVEVDWLALSSPANGDSTITSYNL